MHKVCFEKLIDHHSTFRDLLYRIKVRNEQTNNDNNNNKNRTWVDICHLQTMWEKKLLSDANNGQNKLTCKEMHFTQGCALAVPDGSWYLSFAPWVTRKPQFGFENHILGPLNFTGSEKNWAPLFFLRAQSCWITCLAGGCWLMYQLTPQLTFGQHIGRYIGRVSVEI